jgi:hypothetical protein
MSTFRRILKYTPAVVLGLLVVAWVVSWFGIPRVTIEIGGSLYCLELELGSLAARPSDSNVGFYWSPYGGVFPDPGSAWFSADEGEYRLGLPIPLINALALALAIGPFISFRFRLWHYLAYTALVALELAYYLR